MWLAIFAAAFVAILAEAWLTRRSRRPAYELEETEVSLGLAAGWVVGGAATAALAAMAVSIAYGWRVAELGRGPFGPVIAFVLADLLYYAWHRLSHRLRWLWATHHVHHTAGRLNVLAAFRQGWTDVLSGTWLTWAPLGLLGFGPADLAPYFLTLMAWQAAVHNEWAPRLGPLEWVMVTPSHHRVHHSLEPQHWDRNYGGVLILWDRLFATFVAEGPVRVERFGSPGGQGDGGGPLTIALREWRAMAAEARRAILPPARPSPEDPL